MSRNARIDNEYRSFLREYADSGVFPERSEEVRIIRLVADKGPAILTFGQSELWYGRILPVLAKPMAEQMAVSRIVREGGRVPPSDRRRAPRAPHPFAPVEDGLLADVPSQASDQEALLQIARKLRANA